jgi:hypothetical protein
LSWSYGILLRLLLNGNGLPLAKQNVGVRWYGADAPGVSFDNWIVAAAKRRLEAEAYGRSGDEDALSRRKNR